MEQLVHQLAIDGRVEAESRSSAAHNLARAPNAFTFSGSRVSQSCRFGLSRRGITRQRRRSLVRQRGEAR